jgi:hypothetical protein
MSRRVLPALAVTALVAWSLLAFGGVYPWAALPIVIGAALLAFVTPPRFGGSSTLRQLDGALLVCLAATAFQLVPLPAALLTLISPHGAAFERAYRVDADLGAPASASARALSLSPSSTAYAAVVAGGVLLIFWTARTVFAEGGTRRVARAVSWLGLLVSLLAIVQRAVSPGRIYGFWRPLEPGAQPLGPIINRNYFATWVLLALPLTVGYLMAHVQSHRPGRLRPRGVGLLVRSADPRAMWLTIAGSLMLLALVFSTSRAAVVSLLVAAVSGMWMGRRRTDARRIWALAGYAVVAAAMLVAWANLGALVARLDDLTTGGPGTRLLIWRDTLTLARDFWLTGTGLGSYQTAMVVYQTGVREYFYNHAHSQYLQLAAEGGLLLCVPAALAGLAFARAAGERLRHDTSPIWNVRVGALAGLVAVAVQSVWETGLSLPANGVLAAVLAAIALHRSSSAGKTRH